MSRSPVFATTQWSLIADAARSSSPESRRALASLCETYWYPLYAYVRRRGHDAADAQDLTQAFFTLLLEKDRLALADRDRGKFRSYLLSSLNHFLANHHRGERTQRRGGGQPVLSLDFTDGESRYLGQPSHELTAEREFERRWALTLLEKTLDLVRQEYVQREKTTLFDELKRYLGGDPEALAYQQLAERLDSTEAAVKVAAHRLRKRCREVLRDVIAETVAGPEEVDDELRSLFEALR